MKIKKIVDKKPSWLKPHPLNAEIYGDGADSDLVKSVGEMGVMEPILAKSNGVIISGHRRRNAAEMARLYSVPVAIVEFDDDLEEQEAVIHNNRQREKTTEVKAREFKKLKEIENERGKRNMSDGGKNKGSVNLPNLKPFDAREIAAEKVGMSGRTAEKAAVVVDEIDKLEKEGRKEDADELKSTLNKSVDKAYRKTKGMPPGSGSQATEAQQFATMAISQLERIRKDDPLRVAALERVKEWIENYLKEIEK